MFCVCSVWVVPVAGRVLEPAPQGGAVPVPRLPAHLSRRGHHHRLRPEAGILPHQEDQGQPLSKGKLSVFSQTVEVTFSEGLGIAKTDCLLVYLMCSSSWTR